MNRLARSVGLCLFLALAAAPLRAQTGDQNSPVLSDYFPPPEEQGGWRSLASRRGRARRFAEGADPRGRRGGLGLLKAAWDHNASAPGATGLLVIRRGHIVGEWYRGRRSHHGLQHLFQLEVVHQHGVRPDPLGLRQRPAARRQDAFARHQGLQRRVDSRVAAVARSAQGGDHRPEPSEHGLGPGRAEPAR